MSKNARMLNGDVIINEGNLEITDGAVTLTRTPITIDEGSIGFGSVVLKTPGSTVTIDWSSGNCQSLAMGNATTTLTFTHPIIGNMVLMVTHDANPNHLVFPSVHYQGVTAASALDLTLAGGNTKITQFNIFYDGSLYFVSSIAFHA
jgi:hypothetical protein